MLHFSNMVYLSKRLFLHHLTSSIKIARFCWLYLLLAILLLAACNSTKYVPQDKQLLDRNYIKIDNKSIVKKDIESLQRQKPNKRIFGIFRFHLGLYNLSKPNSEGAISNWLRRIGEEPVIFDEVLTQKTVNQTLNYLNNKGYYYAKIKDTVVVKDKKIKVYYSIITGRPYHISTIDYHSEDSAVLQIVMRDTANSIIKPGTLLDIDQLQSERSRLENNIRNSGYYEFTKDYIYFKADTNGQTYSARLTLGIHTPSINSQDPETNTKHRLFYIRNIYFNFQNDLLLDSLDENNQEKQQVIVINGIEFSAGSRWTIRPSLLAQKVYISPGQLFNQQSIDETYKSLASLRVLKYTNISFSRVPDSLAMDDSSKIDCYIKVSMQTMQNYTIEVEGTVAAGFGAGGNLIYQHKNLLRGAENFELKFKGAIEAIKKNTGTQGLNINNTLELGAEGRITIPKFMLPFSSDQFIKKYNPKTSIAASFTYRQRPQYAHNIANMAFGYVWNGNKFNTHQVNPIDINYVKLLNITPSYDSLLSNTYLKYTYRDHLVAVSNYSLLYSNQRPNKNTESVYLRYTVETAGNSLSLFNNMLVKSKGPDPSYLIFKVPYAQYVKNDIELRYYKPMNQTDRMAYRFFAGIAYPYGNSKTMPFEKQYYSGGPNGIRAWQVRSLGPGSFKDTVDVNYPDKTADIKIEANIEYRFKLIGILEGALFLDAGNIWSINSYDNRPGGLFKFDQFYKQIALGTGWGTRFNFQYFLLRLDIGFKLYNPVLVPTDNKDARWAFNRHITWNEDICLQFGINYPF